MEDKLKEYGLHVEHSEAQDREPIDFEIRDANDTLCATVWGSEPWNDVQVDCEHPYQCIDFGDGEEQGECLLCGATCDYHYTLEEDGHQVPEPHEWYAAKQIGGIIGGYLKDLQRRW